MATPKIENTKVFTKEITNNIYTAKKWFIFSWNVIEKSESMGKDLYIETTEKYGKIFLNGKEILNLANQ